MSAEKAFYKSLGHELVKELGAVYIGAELIPGGVLDAYETLNLPNGMSVRFTSWRDGEGPFYIILFNGTKFLFELDLSMILHDHGRFTWHLKVPSNPKNVTLLSKWLGDYKQFSLEYSASVKKVKIRLQSGVNTPRTGYRFVDDADWFDVCDRFLGLMRRAIKAHSTDANSRRPLREAKDDDGGKDNSTKRKSRRNQSRFRLNLMELYGGTCAMSGEGVLEVLEAAHIVRHAETGINHTGNGLLLRCDLHRLFDAGLIAIDPTSLKVAISPDLTQTKYRKLAGRKIRSRIDGSFPERKYLETHWNQTGLVS